MVFLQTVLVALTVFFFSCIDPFCVCLSVRPLNILSLLMSSSSPVLSRYKGNFIFVERNREKQMIDLHSGIPFESVTLTAIGRNKQMFFDILHQGNLLINVLHQGNLSISVWIRLQDLFVTRSGTPKTNFKQQLLVTKSLTTIFCERKIGCTVVF